MRLGKSKLPNGILAIKTKQGDMYRVDYYKNNEVIDSVLYPSEEIMNQAVSSYVEDDGEVRAHLTAAINSWGDTEDSSR